MPEHDVMFAQEGGASSSSAVPARAAAAAAESLEEVPVQLLPPDSEDKYRGLVKLPLTRLMTMLKSFKGMPLSGSKQDLAVRLLRKLADMPATEADGRIALVLEHQQRKARGRGRVWKLKVVSDKKVGILKEPALDAEVKDYLRSGFAFTANGFKKVGEDQRLFWQLSDGRGWVPQCSRKDISKMVVATLSGPPLEEQKGLPPGISREEVTAILAAEAAAKRPHRSCAKCGTSETTHWRCDKDSGADLCNVCFENAVETDKVLKEQEAAANARLLALLDEEEKRRTEERQQHAEEQKRAEEEEAEAAKIKARLIFEAERLEATRKVTEIIEATAQMETVPVVEGVPKRRRLLKKQQPKQEELDFEAAAEMLEEEGYGDEDDDLPLTHFGGRQGAKAAPPPPCELTQEQTASYHALWSMPPQRLRQMLKEAWLPVTGDKSMLAARLVLLKDGCEPMEADKPLMEQMNHRWRVLQRNLRDKGKAKGAGKGKTIERDFAAVGPSKAELRAFVQKFLSEADIAATSVRDLKEAAVGTFGHQPEKLHKKLEKYVARELKQRLAAEANEAAKKAEEGTGQQAAEVEEKEGASAPAAEQRPDGEESDDLYEKESTDSEADEGALPPGDSQGTPPRSPARQASPARNDAAAAAASSPPRDASPAREAGLVRQASPGRSPGRSQPQRQPPSPPKAAASTSAAKGNSPGPLQEVADDAPAWLKNALQESFQKAGSDSDDSSSGDELYEKQEGKVIAISQPLKGIASRRQTPKAKAKAKPKAKAAAEAKSEPPVAAAAELGTTDAGAEAVALAAEATAVEAADVEQSAAAAAADVAEEASAAVPAAKEDGPLQKKQKLRNAAGEQPVQALVPFSAKRKAMQEAEAQKAPRAESEAASKAARRALKKEEEKKRLKAQELAQQEEAIRKVLYTLKRKVQDCLATDTEGIPAKRLRRGDAWKCPVLLPVDSPASLVKAVTNCLGDFGARIAEQTEQDLEEAAADRRTEEAEAAAEEEPAEAEQPAQGAEENEEATKQPDQDGNASGEAEAEAPTAAAENGGGDGDTALANEPGEVSAQAATTDGEQQQEASAEPQAAPSEEPEVPAAEPPTGDGEGEQQHEEEVAAETVEPAAQEEEQQEQQQEQHEQQQEEKQAPAEELPAASTDGAAAEDSAMAVAEPPAQSEPDQQGTAQPEAEQQGGGGDEEAAPAAAAPPAAAAAEEEEKQEEDEMEAEAKPPAAEAAAAEGAEAESGEAAAEQQDGTEKEEEKQVPTEPQVAAAEAESGTPWTVSFTPAALERFTASYPQTWEPPNSAVRKCLTDLIDTVDLQKTSLPALIPKLLKLTGTLRKSWFQGKLPALVIEAVTRKDKELKHKKERLDGQQQVKWQPKSTSAEDKCSRIEEEHDLDWAMSTLAPFGFKAEQEHELQLLPPVQVALPILRGLRQANVKVDWFRKRVKHSSLGKIVGALRQHPSAEVADLSKEILSHWRSSMSTRNRGGGQPAGGGRK
eukprot:CAMPEP_0178379292 /NCGR_PEP_ID=MMETSP0689_2-20121128/4867_1 /TAXON_ID=160604 /ORGANISM="Amphidinium massartii, Strain CS-259" /LENGTH=1492 /DNA_ID=CAMNT_0019999389 /DNA_START=14 /DNA_END=4489 /DNA_ORIENTATION=+